ncbi:MAG: response regulator [Archangium sp.]|nr:response regulator [Archangium sp.]
MSDATSILVIDDDDVFRRRLARALSERGYDVREAGTPVEALRLAEADTPELALVDLNLAGHSGLEVVRQLVALDRTTRALVLTGYGSIATAVEAMRLGAVGYLPKPADADEILAAFERASQPPSTELNPAVAAPSLARTEWEHIQRVLNDTGGNISETARRLGMHRRSLQRKLAKSPVSR